MSNQLKWTRSNDGYTETKCGRFTIEPVFMGRTTPQAFNVFFHAPGEPRVLVRKYSDTQRDAKQVAEAHVEQLIKTFFQHVQDEQNLINTKG
jgi:hypothetical protein